MRQHAESVVAVGLSHHSSPVEVRERMAVPADALPDLLATLCAVDGIAEAVLLSTCNRTEVYAIAAEPDRDAARLKAFLAETAKTPLAEIEPYLYARIGDEAVRHLFRVAASLDSMVVGESQILGQLKAAFAGAQAASAARGRMTRILERAFAVAKRVRTETQVGDGAVSVASVAVDLARTIFGDLAGLSVLLIGAGEMGRLTLQHLRAAGVRTVLFANRSRERVAELEEERLLQDGHYVPLERVLEPLEQVDIALSSVSPEGFLFGREEAEVLMRRRRGRPLFLVDIAVPRSLDPRAHELEGVFLYDIDDLQAVVAKNHERRRGEAARAEALIEHELEAFVRDNRELDVVPAIRALRERLERIRQGEVERHLGNGRVELSPEARAAVDAATRAILNKVAHGPIRELKRAVSDPEGNAILAALSRALLGDEREDSGP